MAMVIYGANRNKEGYYDLPCKWKQGKGYKSLNKNIILLIVTMVMNERIQ